MGRLIQVDAAVTVNQALKIFQALSHRWVIRADAVAEQTCGDQSGDAGCGRTAEGAIFQLSTSLEKTNRLRRKVRYMKEGN